MSAEYITGGDTRHVGDVREWVGTVGTENPSRKCTGPIDPGQCLPTYIHICCQITQLCGYTTLTQWQLHYCSSQKALASCCKQHHPLPVNPQTSYDQCNNALSNRTAGVPHSCFHNLALFKEELQVPQSGSLWLVQLWTSHKAIPQSQVSAYTWWHRPVLSVLHQAQQDSVTVELWTQAMSLIPTGWGLVLIFCCLMKHSQGRDHSN